MTPEEVAVINAAMAYYRDDTMVDTHNALIAAIDALMIACTQCIAGGHTCPGCGADVPHAGTGVCRRCAEQDEIDAQPVEPPQGPSYIWVERLIVDVRRGDVIRLPGQEGTERTAYRVSPLMDWHVHPKANQYRPNEMPAEWSEVRIAFNDYPEPGDFFGFRPDVRVEIKLAPVEAQMIEQLGWENRLITTGERS